MRKKATIGEETLNVVRYFKFFKSSEGRVYGAVITGINNIYCERKGFFGQLLDIFRMLHLDGFDRSQLSR